MFPQGRNNSQSALQFGILHTDTDANTDEKKTNTAAQSNKVTAKEIHFMHTNIFTCMSARMSVCVCKS